MTGRNFHEARTIVLPSREPRAALCLLIVACTVFSGAQVEAATAANSPNPVAIGKSSRAEHIIVVANNEPSADHNSKKKNSDQGAADPPMPPESQPLVQAPAEQYCSNVQEAAAGARFALQKSELEKMRIKLEERIKKLEETTNEARSWIKQREAFLKSANEGLTEIYSKMPPEAAAARLLVMNETIAVAILSKLPPKTASAVLAEIDTAKAARLSTLLAGVADIGTLAKPRDKATP